MGGKSSKNDFSNQVLLNEQQASAHLPPAAWPVWPVCSPNAKLRAYVLACTKRRARLLGACLTSTVLEGSTLILPPPASAACLGGGVARWLEARGAAWSGLLLRLQRRLQCRRTRRCFTLAPAGASPCALCQSKQSPISDWRTELYRHAYRSPWRALLQCAET